MGVWAVVLVGLGVSADAFAASVTSGLRMRRLLLGRMALIGLTFGGFQALMPLIGWVLASQFSAVVAPVDHWIAFVLLVLIGAKMMWEAWRGEDDDDAAADDFSVRRLLLLGVATSIDAAAIGVSFAMLDVEIVPAALLIGTITLAFSVLGVLVGHWLGGRYRRPAEMVGGLVLVVIGVRILLDHLG